MNPRMVLLFAALLALLPSARGDDSSTYFPFKPGDVWLWDVTITDAKGQSVKTGGKRQVGATVERDGNQYMQMIDSMERGAEAHIVLCRKSETGIYVLEEQRSGNTEQCEIVLPLRKGQIWNKTVMGHPCTSTVVDCETVTVGKVTYEDCYHIRVESDDGGSTRDFWVAPKVGTVKEIVTLKDGGRVELNLREYRPAKE